MCTKKDIHIYDSSLEIRKKIGRWITCYLALSSGNNTSCNTSTIKWIVLLSMGYHRLTNHHDTIHIAFRNYVIEPIDRACLSLGATNNSMKYNAQRYIG